MKTFDVDFFSGEHLALLRHETHAHQSVRRRRRWWGRARAAPDARTGVDLDLTALEAEPGPEPTPVSPGRTA